MTDMLKTKPKPKRKSDMIREHVRKHPEDLRPSVIQKIMEKKHAGLQIHQSEVSRVTKKMRVDGELPPLPDNNSKRGMRVSMNSVSINKKTLTKQRSDLATQVRAELSQVILASKFLNACENDLAVAKEVLKATADIIEESK